MSMKRSVAVIGEASLSFVRSSGERGQTLVEYGLIIAIVSIAIVAALHPMLSGGIMGVFDQAAELLRDAVG